MGSGFGAIDEVLGTGTGCWGPRAPPNQSVCAETGPWIHRAVRPHSSRQVCVLSFLHPLEIMRKSRAEPPPRRSGDSCPVPTHSSAWLSATKAQHCAWCWTQTGVPGDAFQGLHEQKQLRRRNGAWPNLGGWTEAAGQGEGLFQGSPPCQKPAKAKARGCHLFVLQVEH